MDDREAARLAHQRDRWMKPNWRLWVRHDVERFLPPRPPERKYSSDRRYASIGDPYDTPSSASEAAAERSHLAALRFQLALIRLELVRRKALHPSNFNPNQPRVPAGVREGGQWVRLAGDVPGIGHNQGPPLEAPPVIPKQRPPTAREQNALVKSAATWIARAARIGTPTGALLLGLEAMRGGESDLARINAYQDPPKTLDELQQAVSSRRWGYDIHHIVEKTHATLDGFPETMVEGPENRVRIPTLKHWEINGWYARPNVNYDGLSPREYLRDKDWNERTRVGRDALIEYGVLKP